MRTKNRKQAHKFEDRTGTEEHVEDAHVYTAVRVLSRILRPCIVCTVVKGVYGSPTRRNCHPFCAFAAANAVSRRLATRKVSGMRGTSEGRELTRYLFDLSAF